MEQPISDYGTFLMEAKQAVVELNEMQQRESALSQQLKQSKNKLESETKAVSDRINQTIKKRLGDISASYDKELSKNQDQLKKARAVREKAKNQGIKDRIAEETAELREENRELKLQMKTLFQQNHVPRFCRSNWYYMMYSPRWFGEFFKFFLMVLICFLAIPCGSYFLIPDRKPLYLAGIYFACVLIFGGIYVLIGNKTKDRYAETIKKGRLIRDQIHSNEKKIRVITNSIKRDKDEAIYDLSKYDDEIAQIEHALSETAAQKKEALNTFEKVTKNIITDEITENNKEKLELLRETCDFQDRELKALLEEVKAKNLFITDKFGTYLEMEFLQPQKLDALIDIMQNGTAANLSEAMDQYKKRNA